MGSSDRQPYLTSTVLDQAFLNDAHDNLVNQLELICDIQAPDGTMIHASDRNKYVGGTFYEALLVFPSIERTLGDWLVGEIQFSEIQLELSNADSRFNKFLPTGADFKSWIGNTVEIRLGLRDVQSTYFRVFRGRVTQVGGFGRSTYSILIRARDEYDKLNVSIPTTIFGNAAYPKIDAETAGLFAPIIYGDWTTAVSGPHGSVPAFVTNSLDPLVDSTTARNVTVVIGSPDVFTLQNHFFENDDQVKLETDGTLPSGYSTGPHYHVVFINQNTFSLSNTAGPGSPISSGSAGSGVIRIKANPSASKRNVNLTISSNNLESFDTSQVWLMRSEIPYRIDTADIANVAPGNIKFEIIQEAVTQVEGADYLYKSGDQFFVRVKGKNLGAYDDNIVSQARDLLETFGGLVSGDFAPNWNTFRDKSSPAQSAVASIKSRIWLQEPQGLISYVLSLFEQVRLELFVNRSSQLQISSLHLDDFSTKYSAATLEVKNWDTERNSVKIAIDDRNNFNRAKGAFSFLPNLNDQGFSTNIWKNTASVAQVGRDISKQVSFPNLYSKSDTQYQLQEILRLSSAFFEIITIATTWRMLLIEPGDILKLSVKIGATQFSETPVLVRSISYEPQGLKLTLTLWSLQMVPFGSWNPSYVGIIGGSSATLVEET